MSFSFGLNLPSPAHCRPSHGVVSPKANDASILNPIRFLSTGMFTPPASPAAGPVAPSLLAAAPKAMAGTTPAIAPQAEALAAATKAIAETVKALALVLKAMADAPEAIAPASEAKIGRASCRERGE